MKAAHHLVIGTALCMTLGFTGCGSTGSTSFLYKDMTIAGGSAIAGEGQKVLYKGSPWCFREPALKSATPFERCN